MLNAQQFPLLPDLKIKVGSDTIYYIEKFESPIEGTTLDYDIDLNKIKNFTRFEKKKDKLSFKPKVANEG